MKKIILITIALMVFSSSVVFGQEIIITDEDETFDPNYKHSLEDAVAIANEEVLEVIGTPDFYEISKVNKEMYDKYGVIVYGSPHGDKKGDIQRYVGYTPDGNPFGHPTFPKDAWAGGTYDNRDKKIKKLMQAKNHWPV